MDNVSRRKAGDIEHSPDSLLAYEGISLDLSFLVWEEDGVLCLAMVRDRQKADHPANSVKAGVPRSLPIERQQVYQRCHALANHRSCRSS